MCRVYDGLLNDLCIMLRDERGVFLWYFSKGYDIIRLEGINS